MKILGIETSCDESAASIVEGSGSSVKVLSNVVSSQIDIHRKYGGVVPEVAAREHVLNILPVVNKAMSEAGIKRSDSMLFARNTHIPQREFLDAIAVTVGPGLITSLVVGIETAKILAYSWNIPLVAVNHIEGHIYANFINVIKEDKLKINKVVFPAVILTVSGGHTMVVLMKGHGDFEVIGDTRDDAAGEAFDKAAKMMNIGYPGGPVISALAEKFRVLNYKSEDGRLKFPRPMINSDCFNFSFSGLKTAIRYSLEKDENWKNRVPEYCFEFQQAVIDVLISKTVKAAKKFNAKTVMLSGGVSANRALRDQLAQAVKKYLPESKFIKPDLKYTTDNAAMIASAGYFKAINKKFISWNDLKVNCNLSL